VSSEDILNHGRRIAALERQVSELMKLVTAPGFTPDSGETLTFASDQPASLGAADDPRLAELIASGRTIQAVKLYRELTGVGLKEAKDAVEGMSTE
jgi:ribosomal protein L7/L12